MINNKKGQFYLLTALIITTVIIGFAVFSNYSITNTSTKTYNLGQELEIESAKILDHGTYNPEVNTEEKLEELIESYAKYGDIEELYFVFGDSEQITLMGYQQLQEEAINIMIETDEHSEKSPIPGQGRVKKWYIDNPGNNVRIIIDDVRYKFKLKKGENFYFVLIQTIEGERYVVTNNILALGESLGGS